MDIVTSEIVSKFDAKIYNWENRQKKHIEVFCDQSEAF